MQKFSYHMHSTFSDGKNSIKEMIVQAEKLGFEAIGISDHLIVPCDGFSAIDDAVRQHLQDIREAAASSSIKVYTGFEVDHNSHPCWLEQFQAFRKNQDIDYIIGGNHKTYDAEYKNQLGVFFYLYANITQAEITEYTKRHFENITNSILSHEYDFIAHLDFIRWNRMVGEYDYRDERMTIIEALGSTHTPFELNTKGIESIGDYYPARWMLEELRDRDVPVLISDDAHATSQIGRHFEQAESYLQELNYTNRFSLF